MSIAVCYDVFAVRCCIRGLTLQIVFLLPFYHLTEVFDLLAGALQAINKVTQFYNVHAQNSLPGKSEFRKLSLSGNSRHCVTAGYRAKIFLQEVTKKEYQALIGLIMSVNALPKNINLWYICSVGETVVHLLPHLFYHANSIQCIVCLHCKCQVCANFKRKAKISFASFSQRTQRNIFPTFVDFSP